MSQPIRPWSTRDLLDKPPRRIKMTNLVAELAKFARHSDLCAVDQWLPTDVEDWSVPPCNCGLAQLLEQVKQPEPTAGPPITPSVDPDPFKNAKLKMHAYHMGKGPMPSWMDLYQGFIAAHDAMLELSENREGKL